MGKTNKQYDTERDTNLMSPFQIEIIPEKNESFMSWFIRTSFENGTDPKGFAISIWKQDSLLYRDLDRFIPENLLNTIQKNTSLNYSQLKELTLTPIIEKVNTAENNIYRKWYFITPYGQKGKIRTNGIHFCPECLKKNKPFLNKYWRLSFFIGCPIHKIRLLLRCEKCNNIFSPEKQTYIIPHIYKCSKCSYDLRDSNYTKIDQSILNFQSSLLKSIFTNKVDPNFPLITKNNLKDLFLTLYTFIAFIYKVVRQPIRFKNLINDLGIHTDYSFEKIHNGTFSRLNIKDREELLYLANKMFDFDINEIILLLQKNNITKKTFRQTFKNISPTISYILKKLKDKKRNKSTRVLKKEIMPRSKQEVDKLFEEIKFLIE